MKPKTETQRIVEVLESHGHHEIESRSRKYRVFEDCKRPGINFYVGRRGGIRVGKNRAESVSLTGRI